MKTIPFVPIADQALRRIVQFSVQNNPQLIVIECSIPQHEVRVVNRDNDSDVYLQAIHQEDGQWMMRYLKASTTPSSVV